MTEGNSLRLPVVSASAEFLVMGQRGIEIITFDELFRKVEVLLGLLQGTK